MKQIPLKLEAAATVRGARLGESWRCFTADTLPEEAAQKYLKLYGVAPKHTILDNGPGLRLLRLGPVEAHDELA